MSVQDEVLLAETLRMYFVEHCTFLPVKGGAFSLDTLLPNAESMSLQMNGGQTLHQWLDGSRVMLQPFTLFYRGNVADDNETKSSMLGTLNAIGAWMDSVMAKAPPFLGDWLTVNRFEQVQTANIAERGEGNTFIVYQAGYVLGYETK